MSEELVSELHRILQNVDLNLISQGAEALVFESGTHPYSTKPYLDNKDKFIVKFRPPKAYRHPKIDATITKNRTVGEVKFMTKLARLGIKSPAIISADFNKGIIWMEHLGKSLPNGEVSSWKNWLWYLEKSDVISRAVDPEVQEICQKVGALIGKLHLNDMIHGDLTSSNIILSDGEPCLIDFGLSSYSGLAEDKAVDLYVLERAIVSTHSQYSKEYIQWLFEGYKAIHTSDEFKKFGTKKLTEVLRRLDDVRLRGRKRSMIG